jgi:two-component system sensor histidine kinase ChiS
MKKEECFARQGESLINRKGGAAKRLISSQRTGKLNESNPMVHSEETAPVHSKPAPFILAVDDEPVNRRLVERTLEKGGYTVRTAASGEEALEIMRTEVPAVLILDVIMTGMSGYDVSHMVKQNPELRKVPVVFLTAQESVADFRTGREAGALFYLTKPIRPEKLLQVVSMLCPPPKR